MAFINGTFYSNVLEQEVMLDLYLPNDRAEKPIKAPDGVIYFLHGMGSSQKRFREYTAANRYMMDNHLAIVYISAPMSFYSDMKYGMKYYTYITEELPKFLESAYNLKFPREKTFLAGLSMGGYGTLKIGLNHPEMFGAIAPFSAPTNIKDMIAMAKKEGTTVGDMAIFKSVLGEDLEMQETDDPYYLIEQVSKLPAEQQPRIRLMCGKQDELAMIYKQNVSFNEYAKTLPLADYKFMSWTGGHEYMFWDRAMMHAVAFFLENDYDKERMKLWLDEIDM
ncbi:MAG: alpha/beta hydrolase [Oscillospiraceae bacterium]|nr:alpha/beta hydrolase [Oscillospiraceae bacterium]